MGATDYRYFFLTVLNIENGEFAKPYFTLVNDELSRPYGALGSLYCGSSTDGIAVYMDIDKDDLKEWSCQSINLLPFAHQGGGVPNPAICSPLAPSGIPAIYNISSGIYECGTYNQILTLATRFDISVSCGTADFLMYYEFLDEIRCVNPQEIDPSLTLQARDAGNEFETRDLETRVDVHSDKKWHTIMSDMEMTSATQKTWNNWRWTPFMNYDSTSQSSQVPSPPVVLPFASTLLAVTVASFKVSSYTFYILAPTTGDTFTVSVSKLNPSLSETVISNTLVFNSISATSGTVTFSMAGNGLANANQGDAFVGGVFAKSWAPLPSTSDRHLVALTLWIQTTASFTAYWPLA